jgi:hypothetical protein
MSRGHMVHRGIYAIELIRVLYALLLDRDMDMCWMPLS